jgi:hypothetical protein
MKYINRYTPAETALLILPACSLKNMLKFTFMDLILKGVIKVIERKKTVGDPGFNKGQLYQYVSVGTKYSSYSFKPHEKIFVTVFSTDASLQVLFKSYLKMVVEKSDGSSSFNKLVIAAEDLKGLYTKSFLQRIFGGFTQTKAGLDKKDQLLGYLGPVNQKIERLIKSNSREAYELLLKLGGNIFVLNGYSYNWFALINSKSLSEANQSNRDIFKRIGLGIYTLDFFLDYNSFRLFEECFEDSPEVFRVATGSSGCSSCGSSCSSCSSCGSGCGGGCGS